MIPSLAYQPQLQIGLKAVSRPNDGVSRIFAAAVVNRQFCEMLLQDPHIALQRGYLGETFSLSKEEMDAIISIRAETLSDFARQLNKVLNQ
ncbi:MAG: hypothetical protein IH588_09400 [Anaerolineales bacterium]|nr:hypothetical protein [Anaerolineales bacterium]